MIDDLDMDELSKEQHSELKSLLFTFKDVFNDKPGCCKSAMYTIHLKDGYVPKQSRLYRILDVLKPEVDRQIAELLKDGKIIPSVSAYAHPIVLVSKPDGSIRICIDFRHLNEGTINDGYPMAWADDIIRKIAPAKFISTLDATGAYYQIPMDPKCIPMTTFITHRGSYAFTSMPFGCKTASQKFQRVINNALQIHSEYALG